MKKLFTMLMLLLTAFTFTNAQTVTFQVDMSVQIAKGAFDAATDPVAVRGSFNDWGETAMTDDNNDGIYVAAVAVNANEQLAYKYYFNNGSEVWEDGDNKTLDVATSDITVDVTFFNGETMPSGNATTVTFTVDLHGPANKGDFDPAADSVYVAGSFNDWGTGATAMADNGDTTYTVAVDTIASAQIIQFKFIFAPEHPSLGNSVTWEGVDNRTLWVTDDATQSFTAFWDNIDPNQTMADGNITFTVDMGVVEEVGIFDPNSDSTQIRADFNGWSDGDPTVALMNQNFLVPTEWYLQVPFTQEPVDGEHAFKYFAKLADANTTWVDGYERPLSQGGGNRDAVFQGVDNQEEATVYYDDVLPNYVIEAGQNISVGFQVDMTNAADGNIMPLPFVPGTDTVYVVFEQPAFVFSQGWVDADQMRVLELTDDNNDMVYTGTLDIMAPAWNGFEYRYAYGSPTNGWISEPSGYGDKAYRVRYIEQAGYRKFVQPFTLGADTWINAENKSAEWEAAPAGDIVGVNDNELSPIKFELSQNYPNPFNPTTMIRFSVPEAGMVTLKVFNVLGQEVATLVNREMKAGQHEFNFNASKLATGVYVYSLRTGDYNATKKMMLLK